MGPDNGRSLHLVLQYQHREIKEFQTIREGLLKGLTKLEDQLKKEDSLNG